VNTFCFSIGLSAWNFPRRHDTHHLPPFLGKLLINLSSIYCKDIEALKHAGNKKKLLECTPYYRKYFSGINLWVLLEFCAYKTKKQIKTNKLTVDVKVNCKALYVIFVSQSAIYLHVCIEQNPETEI
jgi:hypothetical protein